MHHRLTATLVGAIAFGVLVPTAAPAATRDVAMGPPPKDAKTIGDKYRADVASFFPSRTTIRVGDTVRFSPYGFHNVDLPKKGEAGVQALTPQGTANVNDAAGAPFWFNGQPTIGFNPVLLKASFGKTLTHTGASATNTGLPLGPAKPVKVKFPKRGVFTYVCDIHPGMKGTVHVKSARSSIPSARAHARKAAQELAAARKSASLLSKVKAPTNTVLLGAYKGGADLFDMVPRKLTVPTGTTVTFAMANGSREVHTATFGPGDPDKGTGYVGEIAKSFETPAFDPRGSYPSEPGTIATLTPALHGNGFWNSGLMFAPGKVPGYRSANQVTFGQPGTYSFFCAIHTNMKGEVVVQ